MQRTKIVCTLGPASDDEATIRAFVEAGMAVARINFSHGTHDDQARRIELVRRVASEACRPIAIFADLQVPKLRVKSCKRSRLLLGDDFAVWMHHYERDSVRSHSRHLVDRSIATKRQRPPLRHYF